MDKNMEAQMRGSTIITTLLTWAVLIVLAILKKNDILSTLSTGPELNWFIYLVWLVIILAIIWWAQGWAFTMFRAVTGVYYNERRYDFVTAGGFTIAYWIPTLAYLLLFGFYYLCVHIFTVPWINGIRNPWIFLIIGLVFADSLTALVAYLVFKNKYG